MIAPINFHGAKFTKSAPSIRECPPEEGVEVAFAGRSNAGKSSAINTLTNHKLARVSKTPGRTQLINYFELGPQQRLVDLPGYGYAKVSREMKERWQRYLSEYLRERRCLQGLILLMDIRHPLQEFDLTMLHWACEVDMPVHILLTKADKLSRGQAGNALMAVKKTLKTGKFKELISVQTFSSLKSTGVDELKAKLEEWLALPSEGESATAESDVTSAE